MPEPNLPPLRLNLKTKEDHNDVISVPLIRDRIPELPEESRRRLIEEYQLRPEAAIQLVNEPRLLDYFQELTSKERSPNKIANLLLNDLLTVLNKKKLDLDDCPVTIKQLSEIIDMLLQNQISLETSRKLLEELVGTADSDQSPLKIVAEKNWGLVNDKQEITKMCLEVLENNPKLVKQYKDGKVKVFKALLGIISKNSQNKIDMALTSKILEEVLKNNQ